VELRNATPFPAAILPGALGDDELMATVALKLTAQLDGDRLRPVPPDAAWPVFEAPTTVEGVEFPAELHYGHTLVDLFVIGQARAPGGRPLRQMAVEIRSGGLHHRIDVLGDRSWRRDGKTLVATEPAPFSSMPLTNDRAFGGSTQLDGLPVPYGPNPQGVGFHAEEAEVVGRPLPNLERPDARIASWRDQPRPACLVMPPASSLAFEHQFERDAQGNPIAPTRYLFQGAVPELIAAREDLGPTLTLTGVSPDGPLVYPLPTPAQEPCIEVTVGPRRSRLRLRLSGVVALADSRTIVLTFARTFRYLLEPRQTPREAVVTWPAAAAFAPPAAVAALPRPTPPAPIVAATRAEAPPESEHLFVAQPEGAPTLFLAFRRDYRLMDDGRLVVDEEPRPLPDDYVPYDDAPEGRIPSFRATPEGVFKRGTDVVVQGHAQTYGRAAATVETAVAVGRAAKRVLALGARRGFVHAGRVAFAGPDPFDRVALRWENAYGGIDRVAQAEVLGRIPERSRLRAGLYFPANLDAFGPFAYARNPSGVGFLVGDDPARAEGLVLPQLEDPDDRLTPDRLLLDNPFFWPDQPLPAAYDWVHPTWFPRSALFGQAPPFEPEGGPIPEVTRGLMPADLLRPSVLDLPPSRMPEAIHPDASRAAAPGLRLDPLSGGEPVRLTNIHPARPEFAFVVPEETPAVRFTVRGAIAEARAQRVTLLIEPDAGRVTVVWVAGVTLPRRLHPTELAAVRREITWPAPGRRSRTP
jgi:hypothetical protein